MAEFRGKSANENTDGAAAVVTLLLAIVRLKIRLRRLCFG